jgi:hypothetical protein
MVAAHRELTSHDDPENALGAPPQPGQVEAYASWRAAWTALGKPERDRDEAHLSNGQLHMVIRAYEREQAWAPEYVGNKLAGTHQAAERYRQTAALRAAEAEAATDGDTRAQREQHAREATAVAENLDREIEQLNNVADARARWYAHTAPARTKADRARDELFLRSAGEDGADPAVTAEEWLTAHREAQAADDPHREITDEAELAEFQQQRDAEHAAAEPLDLKTERQAEEPAAQAETQVPDVRDIAAAEPRPDEEAIRVPSSDELARSVEQAQRAIAEMAARHAADEAREAEESRAAQLARWHAADQAVEQTAEREHVAETAPIEPELDRSDAL